MHWIFKTKFYHKRPRLWDWSVLDLHTCTCQPITPSPFSVTPLLSHEVKRFCRVWPHIAEILGSIINTLLTENDPAWMQASLPLKVGGLGVCLAVQVAPSAYFASVTSTKELVSLISPNSHRAPPALLWMLPWIVVTGKHPHLTSGSDSILAKELW